MPDINFETFLRHKDALVWQQVLTWTKGVGAVRHLVWKGYPVRDGRVIDIPSFFAYVSVNDESGVVGVALAANVRFDPRGRGQKVVDSFVVGRQEEITDQLLIETMRQRYGVTEVDFTRTPVAQRVGAGDWSRPDQEPTAVVAKAILRKLMMTNRSDGLMASIFLRKITYNRGEPRYKVDVLVVPTAEGLSNHQDDYRATPLKQDVRDANADFARVVRELSGVGFTETVEAPAWANQRNWDFELGLPMEAANKMKSALSKAVEAYEQDDGTSPFGDIDLSDDAEVALGGTFAAGGGTRKVGQDVSQYYKGPIPDAASLQQYVGTPSVEASQIKSLFGGVDEAISLVNQFDSSLLRDVAFIYNFTGGGAYGVYMSALDEKIKNEELKRLLKMAGYSLQDAPDGSFYATHPNKSSEDIDREVKAYRDKISQSGATTFGIDMNKVVDAARQDCQEGNITDPQDQYMLGVLHLGATMAHEAIHSKGSQSEGPSENVESKFMQWALPVINRKRQDRFKSQSKEQEYSPLIVDPSKRRMASSSWLVRAQSDWMEDDDAVENVKREIENDQLTQSIYDKFHDPSMPFVIAKNIGTPDRPIMGQVPGWASDTVLREYEPGEEHATYDIDPKFFDSEHAARAYMTSVDTDGDDVSKYMVFNLNEVEAAEDNRWDREMDFENRMMAGASGKMRRKAQYGAQFLQNQGFMSNGQLQPWAQWNYSIGPIEAMLDKARPPKTPASVLNFEGQLREQNKDKWTSSVDAGSIAEELLEANRSPLQAYRSTEQLMVDAREKPLMLPVKKNPIPKKASYDNGTSAFGWMQNLDLPMEDRVQKFDENDEETTWFDARFIRNQQRYNPEYGNPMSKERDIYYWWKEPRFEITKWDDAMNERPWLRTTPFQRAASAGGDPEAGLMGILHAALKDIVSGKIRGTRFVCSIAMTPFIRKFYENDADIRLDEFDVGDGMSSVWITSGTIPRQAVGLAEDHVSGKSEDESCRKTFDYITGMGRVKSDAISTMLEMVRTATREAGVGKMMVMGDLPLIVAMGNDKTDARTIDFCSDDPDACIKIGEAACDKLGAVSYVDDETGMLVVKWRCVTFRFCNGNPTGSVADDLSSIGIDPTPLNVELYARGLTPLMLAMDVVTENVIDPTGEAMPDVENKMVRSAMEAETAISQNPLFVFDAIFLASRYDFSIDSSFAKAAKQSEATDGSVAAAWDVIRAVGKGKAESIAEEYGMKGLVSKVTGGRTCQCQ